MITFIAHVPVTAAITNPARFSEAKVMTAFHANV